eukprot:scaffold100801_cov24-Cyclotella_meneghiniana.AAC.1
MAPPKQCVMLKKHGESKSVRNKRKNRTAEIRELIHSVEAIDRFSQWCMNTLADIALDTQANAESARHIALEAQATADSANVNALEAQATADSANDIALDAQANAESANDIALDAQAAADSANDIALDAQANAESARDIALDAQATADSLEIDLCELEKDVDVHNSKITELESDVQDIDKRVTDLEDKLLAVEKSLQDRCKFCESSIQLLRKDVTGASIHRQGTDSDRAEQRIMIIESEIKNFKETQDRETFSLLERLVEIEKVLEAKEEKQDPSLESYQSSVNDDLLKITAGLQHDISQIRSNVATSGDGVIYSSGQAYYDMLVESKVGEKKGHSRAQLKLTAQELMKIEEEESNESNRKIYQHVLDYANQDDNSLFLPDFREEDLLRRLQELKIARENDKHVISSMSDPMTTKLAFNFDQTKEIYNGGEVKDRYDGPNGSGKIQMLKMTFNDTFSTAKRHLKMWHLGGQKVAHFA